jgi:hypothetical protein
MESMIFDILPNDVLFNIYDYLNIVYINAIRFVCKKLHDIIHLFLSSRLTKRQKCIKNLESESAKLGNVKIFEWVISIFGKTANYHVCILAAKYGHLDLLKYLFKCGYIFDSQLILPAAHSGNLNMVKWLVIEKKCTFEWEAYEYAAFKGHLEIVKWAREQGYVWQDEYLSRAAAFGGHMKILKWIREKGCRWNARTSTAAAASGQLDILCWVRENGCFWNEETCSAAALYGHLDILKWARINGCPWNEGTCSGAALGGHLEILKWLREKGCPWNESTCSAAALGGHLEILKWAKNNECPWDEITCSNSAKKGHLEILKWSRENGCPWNENTCSSAVYDEDFSCVSRRPEIERICHTLRNEAWFGLCPNYDEEWYQESEFLICDKCILKPTHNKNLKVLKWARKKRGCPWNEQTCIQAAKAGRKNVLKWAIENGCPWDENVYYTAVFHGHQDIIEWLKSNGYPRNYKSYFEFKIAQICLYTLEWTIRSGWFQYVIGKVVQVSELVMAQPNLSLSLALSLVSSLLLLLLLLLLVLVLFYTFLCI